MTEEGKCFSVDLSVICIVVTPAYPKDLTTLSPFLLAYLPTASAAPELLNSHLPHYLWQLHHLPAD